MSKLSVPSTQVHCFQSDEPFLIRDKRFVVPGLSVSAVCPHCGTMNHVKGDYMDHPIANGVQESTWTCDPGCGRDFAVRLRINVRVEAAT